MSKEDKEVALPDVYKDWAILKDKPMVNKDQSFEWMNRLTDEEISKWESGIQGDSLTAMIDTHILYEVSKLNQNK
jgi:hypothetical protein